LNVPGEAELTGKGVTYSTAAVLDQLRGKVVVVIGGGNSAIESVNVLADVAKHVYLVHRRDRFRAEEILVRKLETHTNVTKCLNAQVIAIQGNSHVTGVTVEYNDKQTEQLPLDAVCINIGFMSKTSFVEQLVDLSEKREVIAQFDGTTKTAGIFAAGDITTGRQKQVVVSAGEGCKAALACYLYVMTKAGKAVTIDQDWEVSSGDHFIRT
jgi:thioredoxin reductase